MPPAFLSVSGGGDVRRPASAQGRLESGAASHRTRPQQSKHQTATFLTYSQQTCQTARGRTPSSATSSSALSSSPSPSHRYDDDSAPTTTWSQRLLSNAQHISPSIAQHYALPTAAPAHQPTHRPSSAAPSTRTPALANLAARHLPASPYLQQHLGMLAQQLGDELTAQHLTERDDDDAVQRQVKRAVRSEMRRQTRQRADEEQKEADAEQDSGSGSPPPVYPFTEHATALRQHVLTLSRLQTRFDTLVQSVSRSSSMHQLLASFSASYLALFSSLLSTLFSLNHHYHFTLHYASFARSSQQAEHTASLSALQHRLRLLSSATQSNHTLARIELQQRQHTSTHLAQLHALLRQAAIDAQQAAQHTADAIDASAASPGASPLQDLLELGAKSFMQSHQLGLLLNALCWEADEEAAERVKLDTLMDEGRKSAKEMWMSTVSKKKDDAAAKQRERKDRETQMMQAAAAGSPTAVSPRGWTAGPYTANGFTLLPLLSRFMRGMQTLLSPRRGAATLESVNSQLVNILVALPAAVPVSDFPTHMLSVILTAQTNPQAAQRHLRSLFTHCTAHCQQPLPRFVLPLIASYPGKASQSVFSIGHTPRSARPAADDPPPPRLIQPASFTLHVVAESLRFLQPLLSSTRDSDLCFGVPLLRAQVPALLTAFFVPASDESLQSQLAAFLDAQSTQPAASLVELLLLFAASYHDCLAAFVRDQLGGRATLGWDELRAVMRAMCTNEMRWEVAEKGQVSKVYVEWIGRCGELAVAGSGGDVEVDEVGVLLDVLSLHRWFMM